MGTVHRPGDVPPEEWIPAFAGMTTMEVPRPTARRMPSAGPARRPGVWTWRGQGVE
jgi:hypothetical protein